MTIYCIINSSNQITALFGCRQNPPPAGYAELANTDSRVVAWQLAQAKINQIALLQSSYQSAISQSISFKNAAGVTSAYPSGNTIAINGQTAKQNLEDCISAGSAAWTLGYWLDTGNIAQTFTYADLQGLAAVMDSVITADWKDLISKIAQVQAATTVTAVQAITF